MNSRIKTIQFNLSALLVLTGAALYLTQWMYAPYLFAVGAAGMAVYHLSAPYKELGFRQRRLQRLNIIAGLLMVGASALMFKHRTEWILCLTIAALLQTYTAFVMPKEK
ncbi:MAG: hypothetical protein RR382_02570 [Tannerellaceae bacterium]